MITALAAVLLCSAASAAPPPVKAAGAAAVHASSAPAAAAAAGAAPAAPPLIGLSTYTVATLYTGDRYRDPFVPPAMSGAHGGKKKKDDKAAGASAFDIHSLQLRGIMKDAKSEFAIFSAEDGTTLVLRGGRLYGAQNKRIPGIGGRIHIKQKRAELITADKDVQVYSLGETVEDDKSDAAGDADAPDKP
jgi:Tfp pilus assembly protein PilP